MNKPGNLFFPFLWVLVLHLAATEVRGQSLHFTQPENFMPGALTDRAIDITNFKGGFFVTWKEPGKSGKVRVSYLGMHRDTSASQHEEDLGEVTSPFAPVLRVLNDRLYLFWIAQDGQLKYVINSDLTHLDAKNVYTLRFAGNALLRAGITTAAIGGKLIIASHAADKDHLVYAVVDAHEKIFPDQVELQTMPDNRSDDYPFVVSLDDTAARFTWKGFKEQGIYCADYNVLTRQWSGRTSFGNARSKVPPALYHVWYGTRLFYIWRGPDKDKRLYYTTEDGRKVPAEATLLPSSFSTALPVAMCRVDGKNFILAYTGQDQKLYLSYFSNYNPATWMQDLLLPGRLSYSLQDVVIPGSHDAGMSVLTATGGQQGSTINGCNTLTQTLHIRQQLEAGIRMFDLRVGTFEKQLYAKHCSSDCMADAIGGGYGEKLSTILQDMHEFLKKNRQEILILSFSHFCEKETPVKDLADTLIRSLGTELIYKKGSKPLRSVTLGELAGKVLIGFEHYTHKEGWIDSCSINSGAGAFVNYRREYAATNAIDKLLSKQEVFFTGMKDGIGENDLVRLDWQLTQSADEAAMICNDFQSDKTSPLLDGAMLLTNVIKKYQSIVDLAITGNKYIPTELNGWIERGMINKKNKPNILYVDAAGTWITDYCIDLNGTGLYKK